MGSFSDYLELALLDHVFGNTAYSAPATVYVELYTANPTDSGGGTAVSTGTWTNYARKAVANNTTNFPNASAGAKTTGAAITFSAASMNTPAATVVVTGIGIFDASTSGNLLAWSALTANKTVGDGDTFSIATGDLDITLD